LADDDANEAELVLNRAALLIHDMGDQEDQLHFKLSQARIMDAKRRFLEASMKYYQLSFETCVEEGERRECL
jgi:COP9 signalosome complex subunit 4